MQIFSDIINLTDKYKNIVLALGTFDGVHIGHQQIITKAVRLAEEINGTSVVLTFSNHPLGVISSTKCPLQIVDNPYKECLMAELGVDILMNITFTQELLQLTPLAFLSLLKENLSPKYIVVGPNYSFGYGGQGKPSLLINNGASFGFEAVISEAVCVDNKIASSTRIRQLIAKGDIVEVNKLLGKFFRVQGEVINGERRGRLLGFPTANMQIAEGRAILPNGVYAAYAIVDGKSYKAIANIGVNPTFKGTIRRLETHIFDFNETIYGKNIEIAFVERIRKEQSFNGADKLIAQINKDIFIAEEILALYPSI